MHSLFTERNLDGFSYLDRNEREFEERNWDRVVESSPSKLYFWKHGFLLMHEAVDLIEVFVCLEFAIAAIPKLKTSKSVHLNPTAVRFGVKMATLGLLASNLVKR